MERSGARAGGRRAIITRSEVKRSEPDGVRLVSRRAVCDFQQRGAAAEKSQSADAHFLKLDWNQQITIGTTAKHWLLQNNRIVVCCQPQKFGPNSGVVISQASNNGIPVFLNKYRIILRDVRLHPT